MGLNIDGALGTIPTIDPEQAALALALLDRLQPEGRDDIAQALGLETYAGHGRAGGKRGRRAVREGAEW